MFANPFWSVLLLAVPFAVYFLIIQPRLKAKFTDLYAHIDSFWGRVWARTYAFRSFMVWSAGIVATALPDLLVQVSSLDLSFLPQPWPMYVFIATSAGQAIMKAFETKPKDEPA